MLTYDEARTLMASARHPEKGKPLQNNTRLYEHCDSDGRTYYAVRLHFTDIVDILPNRTYRLRTGGWYTATTRDRMYDYSPLTWRIRSGKVETSRTSSDGWELRVRPSKRDPEPEHPDMVVPRPFVATDPGPEPVDDGEGCISDTNEHIVHPREHILCWNRELTGDEVPDVADAPPEPTRARHVIRYLDKFLEGDLNWYFADVEEFVTYGRESYRYNHGGTYDKRARHTYKQCPHCAAFQAKHEAWHVRMHGERWGRNSSRGWRQYQANLERYGTADAWRAAYRDDRQRVIAARRLWRAWRERNTIPFYDGVTVNSDGHPLDREVRAAKRRRWFERREEIRVRREVEANERMQRQLARIKAKRAKAKARKFEYRASLAAANLARIADELSTRTTEQES